MARLKCECGNEATCVGSYEDQPLGPACDDCCGHGCEDGQCWQLEQAYSVRYDRGYEFGQKRAEERWSRDYVADVPDEFMDGYRDGYDHMVSHRS